MHSASWNYDAQTKPHFLCLLLQISFVAYAFGVNFKKGMIGYVVLDSYWPVVNINPTKRVEVVSMSACLDKNYLCSLGSICLRCCVLLGTYFQHANRP